jgi:hypothetical protein
MGVCGQTLAPLVRQSMSGKRPVPSAFTARYVPGASNAGNESGGAAADGVAVSLMFQCIPLGYTDVRYAACTGWIIGVPS